MKYRSKKHDCYDKEGNYKDRLSELPDEILVHILSFLPIRCAVRTVLHRRFGKLWTLLRTLKFSYSEEERFISYVMKYHKSPTIDKLEFFWIYEHPKEELMKWIIVGLRKKTRVLSIQGNPVSTNIFLPPRVFRSQCLVSLALTGSLIKLPRRVFMGSLKKLDIAHVSVSDEDFKVLVSGCPCLRELIVLFPHGLQQLHFTSPSIEKLELDLLIDLGLALDRHYSLDCPNLKILHIDEVYIDNLQVIDVSSVREAIITYCHTSEDEPDQDHFEILLDKFRNAHVFRLGPNKAYMQLEHCGNEKLAVVRNEWTHLALRSRVRGSCLLGICRLLRNSEYLNELIIYANVDFFCDCNMLLSELSSPCVMRQLRIVTIRDYVKPCQALLQLIEFLLKSALVLDKLVIVCNRKDQLFSMEGHEFILQLLSFPRVSRSAKVVFA